jgi:membrane-bound serine protease (ClpP class)
VRLQRGRHVTVINIKTEVDLGMLSYVEHALQRAETEHDIVVLDVNTFGGRVDVATKIRDAVLSARVPLTIAFINPRAISAGALISLAAEKIVMTDGATMGAATPIYASGEKASEKVVSYMSAEMRTTAERRHRDPAVAAAMVDETVGLDSSHRLTLTKGKLLTLTTIDARRVGYADTTAKSIEEALANLGYLDPVIVRTDEGIADKSVRFLTNSIVSGILIMFGLAGIFYTIKTGHFGAITLIALFALILFFGAEYLSNIPPVLAIIVFMVGIMLLLVEVSPVPSFGIAGVLGLVGLGLGLYLALAGDTNTLTPERTAQVYTSLAIALVGFAALAALIIKFAPRATWMKKFSNQSHSGDMTAHKVERDALIGKRGTTITLLRPAGLAMIDGEKTDVVTRGEFIPPGTEVMIVEIKGNRNVVEAATATIMDEPVPTEDEPFGGRLPGKLQPRV